MATNIPGIVRGQVCANLSVAVKRTFEKLEAECATSVSTQSSIPGNQATATLNNRLDSVSSDQSPNTSQAEYFPGEKKRKFGIKIARVKVNNKRQSDTDSANSSFSIICDEDLPIFHDMRKRRTTSSQESNSGNSGNGDNDEVVCLTPPNYGELARSMELYASQDDDDGESIFVLAVFPPVSQNSSASSQSGHSLPSPSTSHDLLEENLADSQNDEETRSTNPRV